MSTARVLTDLLTLGGLLTMLAEWTVLARGLGL